MQGANHVKKGDEIVRKKVSISTTQEDTDILFMPSERQPKNRILILLGVCSAKSAVRFRVRIYAEIQRYSGET